MTFIDDYLRWIHVDFLLFKTGILTAYKWKYSVKYNSAN